MAHLAHAYASSNTVGEIIHTDLCGSIQKVGLESQLVAQIIS